MPEMLLLSITLDKELRCIPFISSTLAKRIACPSLSRSLTVLLWALMKTQCWWSSETSLSNTLCYILTLGRKPSQLGMC